MSRIHLTIDRLSLPPLAPAERDTAVRALHAELAHALAEPSLRERLAQPRRTPVLHAGALPQAAQGPRALGTAVAQAVVKGLAR